MKNEIDKDLYCSVGYCSRKDKRDQFLSDCIVCKNKHRKHPTPEQYKEEYGEEWTGAVYSHCCNSNNGDYSDCTSEKCKYFGWGDGEEYGCLVEPIIVCACTPYPKPDNDWRPE